MVILLLVLLYHASFWAEKVLRLDFMGRAGVLPAARMADVAEGPLLVLDLWRPVENEDDAPRFPARGRWGA